MSVVELKQKLDKQQVEIVFDRFDLYAHGEIDIRFMGSALAGMKYDVPKKLLQAILKKHDTDENGCFDKKEFKKLLRGYLMTV